MGQFAQECTDLYLVFFIDLLRHASPQQYCFSHISRAQLTQHFCAAATPAMVRSGAHEPFCVFRRSTSPRMM